MKLSGYIVIAVGVVMSKPLAALVWGFEFSYAKAFPELWQAGTLLLAVYAHDRWLFKGPPA